MVDVLEFETKFYIGICIGSVVSAFLFMVVFKKKIYLLIVFFNSISIIVEIFKMTIMFLDSTAYKTTQKHIIQLPESIYIVLGVIDIGSLFLLITLLPALLAIKYRGNKFEITMAGTLISIVAVLSYIFGTVI